MYRASLPVKKPGRAMCAPESTVKPVDLSSGKYAPHGYAGPLRIDCLRCGAKPGQLCKSKTGLRMCHKERRRRSRKPKELRSSHWGRPYPKGKYRGLFSRHPKLMGDHGLQVSRNIDTTISVHFPCGFHIEIGNAYLPRSLTAILRQLTRLPSWSPLITPVC
jgi:hypothetical protein